MYPPEIELEQKSKKRLDGFIGCTCGQPATELIEIGVVGVPHGSFFDVCPSQECLESAFEIAAERILNARAYYEPSYEEYRRAS